MLTSLKFDGVDDYVNLGAINESHITIEYWVKIAEAKNYLVFISNREPLAKGYFIYAGIDFIRPHTGHGSGYNWFDTAWNPSAHIGEWHHFALTNDGAKLRFYIDGIEDASSPVNASPVAASVSNTTLGIDSKESHFKGNMGDVRIWNLARTQQQIQDNMHSTLVGNETGLVAYYKTDEGTGTLLNDSAGAKNGTIYGATWEVLLRVAGVVTDADNNPTARTVRVYNRTSGALIGGTVSDAVTGEYAIGTPTTDPVLVVALSPNESENALVRDRVVPE